MSAEMSGNGAPTPIKAAAVERAIGECSVAVPGAAIQSAAAPEGSSLFAIGGSLSALSVPEPASWTLMAAGLLIVVLGRRKLLSRA